MPDEAFNPLLQKLAALRGDTLRRAERRALRAVGDVFVEAIQAQAPERTDDFPAGEALAKGELKASINARVSVPTDEKVLDGRSARVRIGPNKKTWLVAERVENGHETRGSKKNAPRRTAANPFVRRAFDETEAKGIETYEAVITKAIQKAMKQK